MLFLMGQAKCSGSGWPPKASTTFASCSRFSSIASLRSISFTFIRRIVEERIDFGLISPYKAQVQYLRSRIKGQTSLRPYRELLTVNTVDGFQGQERDVIFISLVRANEEGQIGFLNDLRRMNVAITRARMKLVILGETATLGHHPFYRKLLSYIQEQAH